MPTEKEWKDAVNTVREQLPMEAELWGAGCDLETAHFVAGQLRRQGYYLVREQDIGWPQIEAFSAQLHKGQSIFEDAGGYFVRCIMALFGKQPDREVVSYRAAVASLLEEIQQ